MTDETLSPVLRGLITIAVMTATLLQVLDVTIVNVALPHMQGSLGASPDSISWVLTSYLVSSAILMPLTGYFTDRLGRKNYLLLSIAGFVLASALCGAATSISQIVFFRLLQGAFGAALVPLSQAILVDIYPVQERGTAMAIWGIGVMVGPVLGPTLGGYLTDVATWRWNFYINIPFGLISLFLTWQVLPDTVKKMRKMDWLGLILLSTSIGSTQYFLDRGNQENWFESGSIAFSAFLAVVCLLGFILHSLSEKKQDYVFDLAIFKDRNFTICSLLIAMLGLGLFGAMVVIPLMLEALFNYPVMTTGLVMAPRGLSAMISMLFVGKLMKHMDPRYIIGLGIFLSSIGMYVGRFYNLDISEGWVVGPMVIQGLGLGLIFVPLSSLAYSTLPIHLRSEAAGLFSLLRTLGSSIGISIVITMFTRHSQIAWKQLGGFIQPFNPAVSSFLQHFNLSSESPLGIKILTMTLQRQAEMIAFINVFSFVTISILIMLPFIFFLKKPGRGGVEEQVYVE